MDKNRSIVLNISECAACGGHHAGLRFWWTTDIQPADNKGNALEGHRSVEGYEGVCPTLGVSILSDAYARPHSMFSQVVDTNVMFGNPQGDPENLNWERLEKQTKNILDEYDELQEALVEKNPIKLRDALCDIVVFALGAHHLMGEDAEADMTAVFASNCSKFCTNEEELQATKDNYTARGVKFYEEGEFPKKYLKSAEDQPGFPKGKFLKCINFKEPVFATSCN